MDKGKIAKKAFVGTLGLAVYAGSIAYFKYTTPNFPPHPQEQAIVRSIDSLADRFYDFSLRKIFTDPNEREAYLQLTGEIATKLKESSPNQIKKTFDSYNKSVKERDSLVRRRIWTNFNTYISLVGGAVGALLMMYGGKGVLRNQSRYNDGK